MNVLVDHETLTDLLDPGATIERLGTGCTWSEGPAYLPDEDAVIWSDIPNDRIMRWTAADGVKVHRIGVEYTNGRTLDLDGRVIACSHGNRRIERVDRDGTVTSLVARYQGRRLNSPNDVVVKSDGTIWFTDPPYGIIVPGEGHQADSEIGDNYVFRFDPVTGELTAVTDIPDEPNGLAFSPDESVLYVTDTSAALRTDGTGNHHIVAYDVVAGRSLDRPRVFAVVDPGVADGLRVDRTGHVFTSAADGIHIYSPSGVRLGKILVPEKTSNCTFGGRQGQDLYITASTSLYRITTRTSGPR